MARTVVKEVFQMSNYDGASKLHNTPEEAGRFILDDGQWVLRFKGTSHRIQGPVTRTYIPGYI